MITKEEIIRILEAEEEVILDENFEDTLGTVVWDDRFSLIAERILELLTSKFN